MAEISVILPVWGVEKWLRQCVDSILNQSFRDFELILIDDGSPDGCGKICDGYARLDRRVRVIHQENRGVSAARNAGLDLAVGRYVTFCDGDDFWERSHLARLYRAAEETGADLISCNYLVISEAGEWVRESRYPAGIWELEESRTDYILGNVLQGKTGWAVWNRLFRGDRIRQNGLRFCESCRYGEDLAFVAEYLLYCSRVCAVPEASCSYRLRRGSATDRIQDRLPQLHTAGRHISALWEGKLPRKWFSLVYFGILREPLEAIPAREIPAALARLPDGDWIRTQARALLRQKAAAARYFGPRGPGLIALCRFCLHRKSWLYRLERKILG